MIKKIAQGTTAQSAKNVVRSLQKRDGLPQTYMEHAALLDAGKKVRFAPVLLSKEERAAKRAEMAQIKLEMAAKNAKINHLKGEAQGLSNKFISGNFY